MAKQDGPLRIRGKVGDLFFFRNRKGSFVREHTALSADKIKTEAKFERTRENMAEFKLMCLNSKTFRQSVALITRGISDKDVHLRVNKLMAELNKLDNTSLRGERNAAVALTNSLGKQLLKGFNFNVNASIDSIVNIPFAVDTVTGSISINGFAPKLNLKYPVNATHVKMRGAWVKLDLSSGQSETVYTNTVILPIDSTVGNVQLNVANAPVLTGCSLFIVAIENLQEVNGQQYPIFSSTHTACSVIEVN